jgi:hypothetical protein
VDKQKRSRIAATGTALETVAHNEGDVIYPEASEEPVEGLEVYGDGVRCMGQ